MTEMTPHETLQIGIGVQYIKDFSFENPQAPQIFTLPSTNPEVDMTANVQAKSLDHQGHEVILSVKLTAKVNSQIAYIAEIAYGGVFVMPRDMNEGHRRMFLMTEAPRLLFPFVRSLLSNLIREGGFPPILLNPIDFTALYRANHDQVGLMPPAGVA